MAATPLRWTTWRYRLRLRIEARGRYDSCVPPPAVIRRYCLVYAIGLLAAATLPTAAQSPDDSLYSALSADIAKLAPQTIHPAEGAIKYPYLIPAGYYPQMWDWDGFFIGVHWANQDAADA